MQVESSSQPIAETSLYSTRSGCVRASTTQESSSRNNPWPFPRGCGGYGFSSLRRDQTWPTNGLPEHMVRRGQGEPRHRTGLNALREDLLKGGAAFALGSAG